MPVTALGIGYVAFGIVHLLRMPDPALIDAVSVGVLEVLGVAVAYGGRRTSQRELSVEEAVWAFGVTVGIAAIGFTVATVLITLQVRRGVPIEDQLFLMVTASATTAAIGVAVVLYHLDLRAERDRVQAQAETLGELNKRLTVLHRVMRHNLRNEITVIRGYAEHLLNRDPRPEQAASLRTIVEHADQVAELSENAYRLRQVWNEDVLVDLEVTELVEREVRALESAHPAVAVSTELATTAGVRAHPRLDYAVREALENAVVHNDPETVDVAIRVRQLDGADPAVEVAVEDTGRGIPDFEPDVLEQVEEHPLEHASGLGLWLMYWVVEQSGGTLRFDDNEPQGTLVRMRLPAASS